MVLTIEPERRNIMRQRDRKLLGIFLCKVWREKEVQQAEIRRWVDKIAKLGFSAHKVWKVDQTWEGHFVRTDCNRQTTITGSNKWCFNMGSIGVVVVLNIKV